MYKSSVSSLFAAWISVISNIIICLLKIGIGIVFRSQVLIADGIHNGADILASVTSLSSIKIADQPADDTCPYGYGKVEHISSGIISIILMLASFFMLYQSIESLFKPSNDAHIITFLVAVASLIWKLVLYSYTIHIGQKENSQSLIATAYDHLADVYISLAAILGIGITLLNKIFPIPYAIYSDPFFGILVSLLVFKMAIKIGRNSLKNLMEVRLPAKKCNEYQELIQVHPYVKQINKLCARDYGRYIIIDAKICIPEELTIYQGNKICKEIQTIITQYEPKVKEVFINLIPWDNTK